MRSNLYIFFIAFFISLTLAPAAFSQNGHQYIFPGITLSDEITIGNLNPVSTTATIAFYDSSGKLNSLTVELASGTQTRVNSSSVALTRLTGSGVSSGPLP